MLWGVGYTFTSGAGQAWVTDELGAERVGSVFVRQQQIDLATKIAGIVAAGALGLAGLRLPLVVSGAGMLLLAAALVVVMGEHNFTPVPRSERETFKHLTRTLADGLHVARTRPVVRGLVLIGLVSGLSTEAFDRLWSVQVLTFTFPDWFGTTDPAFWFSVLALVGTFLALGTSLAVTRISPERLTAAHPNGLLALLAGVQLGGVIAFALLGQLWLALAAMWTSQVARTIAQPVEAAWLNRHLDSGSRATVLSLVAQADAIGQVAGGPPLGALAGRAGLRTALVVSGLILAPIPLLYLRLRATPAPRPADPADRGAGAAAERSTG